MKKVQWINRNVYSHHTVTEWLSFINKNMVSLLPLYGREKQRLFEFADVHGLTHDEVTSLRNTIRVQKEIRFSRISDTTRAKIVKDFEQMIESQASCNTSTSTSNQKKNSRQLLQFFRSFYIPFRQVVRVINELPVYQHLCSSSIETIQNIEKRIRESEQSILANSVQFERILEDQMRLVLGPDQFRTEADIKRDGDYTATPDILFHEPITIFLHDQAYTIRWMDAKNYLLTNTPFIINSLKKQSAKYNQLFGMGAFVFRYGIDSSISIPGAIILDYNSAQFKK